MRYCMAPHTCSNFMQNPHKHELQSKLLKGQYYIGEYIGDCDRVIQGVT